MVAHVCTPSIQETQVGRLGLPPIRTAVTQRLGGGRESATLELSVGMQNRVLLWETK